MAVQAKQSYLGLIRRRDGAKAFVEQAELWLKELSPPAPGAGKENTPSLKTWRQTDGFQGVCLDLAKEYLAAGRKDDATALLKQVANGSSEAR